MGALHDLYAVQLTDIAISQAQHRLAHLPESASYLLAKSASQKAIADLTAIDKQSTDAGTEIAGLEKQAHEIDATLARLNKQMKKTQKEPLFLNSSLKKQSVKIRNSLLKNN